jgi:hypothetical protein
MERKTLAIAVGLCGIAGLGVGMAVLFVGGPPPAPPRPRRPPIAAGLGVEMRYSSTLYRALIEQDAQAMGVVAPTWDEMMAVFPYFDELSSVRSLRVGDAVRSAHLRLSLGVRRVEGAVEGQSFRADHLVMRIENLTGRYLSYRVTTRVPAGARCEAKGVMAHDAIALRPHETILRTECLFQKAASVDVVRVEVMEVTPLSYHYVSRLIPGLILYDARTAAGHSAPKGAVCPQTFSWRDIRDGALRGEIAWRDIIDFYARHNCDEYTFFPGYRYRSDPGAALPARPAPTPQ